MTTAHDTNGTPLRRIGQVSIPVRDLDRAVRFYRDTLGMRLLFQAPPGLAFFDCAGVRLMLARPEQGEVEQGGDNAGSVLYYVVHDINQAHTTLASRGARFEDTPHVVARMPDHDLWMTFLRDSEGNLVGMMEERARDT